MNKTDRLLAIVLELQRHGMRRAEDLAAVFETSVRTIYRDVQALSEAGVPVVGAPGQGYSLTEGYFLPPVSFSAEESVALLLGLDYVEQQFDAGYHASAASARGKVEAILPEAVRRETERARASVRMLSSGAISGREKETLATLRRAILNEYKVRFHYSKKIPEPDGGRHGMREVEPYGLVLIKGAWTLVAFDPMRQGMRHFRLSRMIDVEVTDERFQLPKEFDLQAYMPPDNRNIIVLLQISPEIADRVMERNSYYTEGLEHTQNGLLMTMRIRHELDVLEWIMSWGPGVVVLEPESLRELVRQNLIETLQRY